MFDDDRGILNGFFVFCMFAAIIFICFGIYVVAHFITKFW